MRRITGGTYLVWADGDAPEEKSVVTRQPNVEAAIDAYLQLWHQDGPHPTAIAVFPLGDQPIRRSDTLIYEWVQSPNWVRTR